MSAARLTVVVAVFNMRREAPRTLFTLSPDYQRDVEASDYEVVVVDNGSTQPLDAATVESFGPNFSLRRVSTTSKSPAAAINAAVREAGTRWLLCMIDGARMLSPRILQRGLEEIERAPNSLVYAPSLHLGAQLQNDLVVSGYDQVVEDRLLESIDWRSDGYRLFDVSNVAAVPERITSPTFESNCFFIDRARFLELGGYSEAFASSGGGLVNWHFFRHAVADRAPVISLLGEATFHQFHGGAATNHTRKDHPFSTWLREYESIEGSPYRYPEYDLRLSGTIDDRLRDALLGANAWTTSAVAREMLDANRSDAGIAVLEHAVDRNPNDPAHLRALAEALLDLGRLAEADSRLDAAIAVAPTQAELWASRARGHRLAGRSDEALRSALRAIDLDPLQHEAAFEHGLVLMDLARASEAVAWFVQAIEMNGGPTGAYAVQHAMALDATGRTGEAWRVLNDWLDAHPHDLRAVLDLATLADRQSVAAGDARERDVAERMQRAIAMRVQPFELRGAAAAWLSSRGLDDAADRVAPVHDERPRRARPQRVRMKRMRPSSERSPAEATAPLFERFLHSVEAHYASMPRDVSIEEHALSGSIKPEDAALVAEIVAEKRPAHILEIGTYLGLGTTVLLEATSVTQAAVTTIDPSIRHRCFDDPQAHARSFIGDERRARFVTAFFGERSGGGTHFDAAHFEPHIPAEVVDAKIEACPVARPRPFDLIFVDPGLTGVDVYPIMQQAVLSLGAAGGTVLVGAADAPAVQAAIEQLGTIAGGSVERLGDRLRALTVPERRFNE